MEAGGRKVKTIIRIGCISGVFICGPFQILKPVGKLLSLRQGKIIVADAS